MADGVSSGRCPCSNCRTGKCQCIQCREGPGINFQVSHQLYDEIMSGVVAERERRRRERGGSLERQIRVRRWGEINTGRTEDRETIRNEIEE